MGRCYGSGPWQGGVACLMMPQERPLHSVGILSVTFSKQVWDQLKGKTCEDLMAALERDGFLREQKRGATQGYRHPDGRRVVIHYHPNEGYKPKLLKALIEDIGWSEADLRHLKLIRLGRELGCVCVSGPRCDLRAGPPTRAQQ